MKAFALCYLIGVTAAGPLPDPFNAQSLNPMRANIQTTKLNIHNRAKGFESLPDSYFQGFNGTDSSSLSLTFRGLEEEAVEPPPGTIFYDIPPYQVLNMFP